MRALMAATLVLIAGLAGCVSSGDDPEPAGNDPTTSPGGGNATQPVDDPIRDEFNVPPSAALNASALNGSAPLAVNFTLEGEDANGDNLTWTLDVDGDGVADANGTTLPAETNHTYLAPGLFNVTLVVSDGPNSSEANLTIEVLSGTPEPLTVADPDGEATTDFAEILSIGAAIDGERLVLTLTMVDLWPTTAAVTPVIYSVYVGENRFDSFGRYPIDNNPMTWDTGAGGYMPAGTSAWDQDANTVTFYLPLSLLAEKGFEAPYSLKGAAGYGALTNHEDDDVVPNSGTVTFG